MHHIYIGSLFPSCSALKCGADMVYEFSAPACLPTCIRPNAPEECGLPRTESCVCVDKTAVVSGGKCVAAESCGCTDDNGVHREVRTMSRLHFPTFLNMHDKCKILNSQQNTKHLWYNYHSLFLNSPVVIILKSCL